MSGMEFTHCQCQRPTLPLQRSASSVPLQDRLRESKPLKLSHHTLMAWDNQHHTGHIPHLSSRIVRDLYRALHSEPVEFGSRPHEPVGAKQYATLGWYLKLNLRNRDTSQDFLYSLTLWL
jgi:hypothetical protein